MDADALRDALASLEGRSLGTVTLLSARDGDWRARACDLERVAAPSGSGRWLAFRALLVEHGPAETLVWDEACRPAVRAVRARLADRVDACRVEGVLRCAERELQEVC